MDGNNPSQPRWFAELDPRERAQILHAWEYAHHHAAAGAPGHGQFLLIAKLATMLLDKAESSEPAPGITAALHPTESIADAISAIEDIAELVGWPSIDTDRADDNFVITFKRGGL